MRSQVAFALVLSAVTIATAIPTNNPGGSCNVGTIQCCNSVQSANDNSVASLLGLLGIVLGPVTGQVGLDCSPITAVGVGGNNCAAQPVCCEGNHFDGLINVGCSPVNINL